MKINANTLKIGFVIKYQDRLLVITKKVHTKPGKGGAYVQVELKDFQDGTKFNERFRASEDIEKVFLEEREYDYLYYDSNYHFMDPASYEQIDVPEEIIGEQKQFLEEGMKVKICTYEDKIVSIQIPEHIIMVVKECEPVVKGQTATSSFKPAVLHNGLRVMVPPHIEPETKIVVNSQELTYIERAK